MRSAILAGLMILCAGRAAAAVTVFGGGKEAQACYAAAKAGRSDDVAIDVCTLALQQPDLTDQDRGGTLINRGVMYLRRMTLPSAQADLDAGVSLDPAAGEGWLDRGAVYIAERRWRIGIAFVDRAIALGVVEPEKAYYDRARAEEELDDAKAAYFDYLKAVELKPDWDLPKTELTRFSVVAK
jgi:tetratricopeptide (TPR) repeat protein